jgi:hypothetical protein
VREPFRAVGSPLPSSLCTDYLRVVVGDYTPPASSVDPIEPYWRTSLPATITATASDELSGVEGVELWYRHSPDNAAWGDWRLYGVDDCGADGWSWTFGAPEGDGHYEFYSVARDRAGNVEAEPAGADARCGVDTVAPRSGIEVSYLDPQGVYVVEAAAEDNEDSFRGSGVARVELWYRVRLEEGRWGEWCLYGADEDPPYEWVIESREDLRLTSVARDAAGNIEPRPALTVTTDRSAYSMGEEVVISGTASYLGRGAVRGVPVSIRVERGGLVRSFTAETDGEGRYACSFSPPDTEAGRCSVRVQALGLEDSAPFLIHGLRIEPPLRVHDMGSLSTENLVFGVANRGETDLSGIWIEAVDLDPADGVTILLDTSAMSPDLSPGQTTSFAVLVSSGREPRRAEFRLVARSREGAASRASLWVSVHSSEPVLVTDPPSLEVGMAPGGVTTRSVRVRNEGYGPAENVLVVPPPVGWIGVFPSELGSIPAGGSATLSLTLCPHENVEQGVHETSLQIRSANHPTVEVGVGVSLNLEPVGGLSFQLRDPIGRPVEAPHTVSLFSQDLGVALSRQAVGGAATFENLRVGLYSYEVSSPRPERGWVSVEPGVIKPVEVTIDVSLVEARLDVQPTSVEDVYTVHLEYTFEAEIPVPFLQIDPPGVLREMYPGEVYYGSFEIRNTGLVRIFDVTPRVESGRYLTVEPGASGFSLEAGQGASLPFSLRLSGDAPKGDIFATITFSGHFLCWEDNEPVYGTVDDATFTIAVRVLEAEPGLLLCHPIAIEPRDMIWDDWREFHELLENAENGCLNYENWAGKVAVPDVMGLRWRKVRLTNTDNSRSWEFKGAFGFGTQADWKDLIPNPVEWLLHSLPEGVKALEEVRDTLGLLNNTVVFASLGMYQDNLTPVSKLGPGESAYMYVFAWPLMGPLGEQELKSLVGFVGVRGRLEDDTLTLCTIPFFIHSWEGPVSPGGTSSEWRPVFGPWAPGTGGQTVILPKAGVLNVSIFPPEQSGEPGENLVYTLTLAGERVSGYYRLEVENLWPIYGLPAGPVKISSAWSREFWVHIPENAGHGDWTAFRITARRLDGEVVGSASAVARCQFPPPAVSIPAKENAGLPGEVLTYKVIVQNQFRKGDSFSISVESGWPAWTEKNEVYVKASSRENVELRVQIPADAPPGARTWSGSRPSPSRSRWRAPTLASPGFPSSWR